MCFVVYTNISLTQSNGWQQSFSICDGDSDRRYVMFIILQKNFLIE